MRSLLAIALCLLSISLYADEESSTSFNLFKSKTYVKNPLDLRDPFKRKINKKKSSSSAKSRESGVFTNQVDSIENKSVENIRIVGVMIGADRRAMAKVSGSTNANNIYFLKEGMKIGPNGAEVKAILPGGVVLVEKIRNVYDQDEYLETVLPLSNE